MSMSKQNSYARGHKIAWYLFGGRNIYVEEVYQSPSRLFSKVSLFALWKGLAGADETDAGPVSPSRVTCT